MTDVRFLPLTAELLLGAVLEERDGLTRQMATAPGWLDRLLPPHSVGYAMLGRGRVLAAGGATPIWRGRAEAWLMLSPQASGRERCAALRRTQLVLDTLQGQPAFRRIEMYVRAREPWCERFGRLLGFRAEGELRAWDPWGRDYRLFARVAEG